MPSPLLTFSPEAWGSGELLQAFTRVRVCPKPWKCQGVSAKPWGRYAWGGFMCVGASPVLGATF